MKVIIQKEFQSKLPSKNVSKTKSLLNNKFQTTNKTKLQPKLLAAFFIAALTLNGCAGMTETQKTTTKGAGIGAAGGAVVGAVIGGTKGAVIGAAVGGVGGGIAGNVWSKRMQAQKKQMEQATAGTGVAVTQTVDNRLKIDIPSDISFDSGSSSIKANLRSVLDTFANGLVKNPAATINIVGHTDNTGSDAVNNPLSFNRAVAARDYLSARGVAASRFAVDGRGSREPIASNAKVADKAKNRRVEIYVTEPAQVGVNTKPNA